MSYNTVLKTSMWPHYLGTSPSWQPTVYPLTGYTSPLHTPYHSCICYYQTRRDYPCSPRTVGGPRRGGGAGGLDDGMLQTVSLYVIVYSVRSSTSLEQSIRTSVRGHFLPSKQTHTEHNLLQRCRDPDKIIYFLALVTLMGHLDGCSRIYEKPFQSESHYFFQSV